MVQPGTPAGRTIELRHDDSAVYPGTTRRFWIHLPPGHDPPYPELIPQVPRRPLPILRQARHHDLGWNAPERNWLAENLRTAAALAESGQDFRLVLGNGPHSPDLGGSCCLTPSSGWHVRPSPAESRGQLSLDDRTRVVGVLSVEGLGAVQVPAAVLRRRGGGAAHRRPGHRRTLDQLPR